MPRVARVKSEEGIYHIMFRSISEVNLFLDDLDKIKYFKLIYKYQKKFQFKVYAYCLMDSHGHMIIDCNGADISKIMHSINFCYAQYFNRKYNRHGHLFQDRFKSKIIKDEKYFIVLSAYIHNNPKDLSNYKDRIEEYGFCSLNDYIKGTNQFEILDTSFLSEILNLDRMKNKKAYIEFVKKCESKDDIIDVEFEKVENVYKSERRIIPRDYTGEQVIEMVAKYFKMEKNRVHVKYKRQYVKLRAISCFLMSCYCNINQKNICQLVGNITQTRVSSLSMIGMEMAFKEKELLDQFLKIKSA
ncbi:transposase [Inediibacterium massiliense]|uniref:transposase n=1 Tax=Inediibacterium massiliense TaxID=1658111 RepID=UPI0006B5B917|nr:transposase [Inediibacterium massiliense]